METMITLNVGHIVALCAAIITITGAMTIIYRIVSPAFKVIGRVTTLERRQEDFKKKLDEDKRANNILCKAMLALIDNRITDNCIDNLKIVKTDLVNFLAD